MSRLDACHRAGRGPRLAREILYSPGQLPYARRPHTATRHETQPDPAGPGRYPQQGRDLREHSPEGSGPRCASAPSAEPGPRRAQAADLPGSGPQLAHRHREPSPEPLPDTPSGPVRRPGLTGDYAWQVLGSNQRRRMPAILQGAHSRPSEWPLTCGFSNPRRGKTAFCPRGVRNPGVCLVSATHVLDHVPRGPAESCCVQFSRCHPAILGAGWARH
jgi:hypothetical protein